MVELVALGSSIKVLKFNSDNNLICIYPSITKCIESLNITKKELINISNNHLLYNNFYYQLEKQISGYTKVKCEYCGNEFYCEDYRLTHSHLFCSKQCESQFTIAQHLNCTCLICGKKFHAKPYLIKNGGGKYCSKKCHYIAKETYMLGSNNHQYGLKGQLNSSWKSNERISYYGYKLIRNLDHPYANSDGFVFEHRLIAEKFLLNDKNSINIKGENYLDPKYVVHHIDFDRQNNEVLNLLIMNRDEHTKMHRVLLDETALKEYCRLYNLSFDNVLHNRDIYKAA